MLSSKRCWLFFVKPRRLMAPTAWYKRHACHRLLGKNDSKAKQGSSRTHKQAPRQWTYSVHVYWQPLVLVDQMIWLRIFVVAPHLFLLFSCLKVYFRRETHVISRAQGTYRQVACFVLCCCQGTCTMHLCSKRKKLQKRHCCMRFSQFTLRQQCTATAWACFLNSLSSLCTNVAEIHAASLR